MPFTLRGVCTTLLMSARSLTALSLAVLGTLTLCVSAKAAPVRVPLQVTGYLITADLDPANNKLTATAVVSFTALDDLNTASFELNNGLQLTKLTDAAHNALTSERLSTNSTVRVALTNPIPKGTSTAWTFEYTGVLKGADTSPVEGIKLASVEDPISILLYAGRWFPMVGLFTDRFTAEMHVRVPSDERVVGSGSGVSAVKSLPGNRSEYTFNWAKPGFPGTIVAGRGAEVDSD